MDDPKIRSALKSKVLAPHLAAPGTRVIDELGLNHGASRVDVAVINGVIHGYEIKSDRDTLIRLAGQAKVYGSALDRITLVAGPRHVDAATRRLPSWWGIKIAHVGKRGAIHFDTVRRASTNPCVEALAVARLLWRPEAIRLLELLGAERGQAGVRRALLYARLVEIAPLPVLQRFVRECLKQRSAWRFGSR